LVERLLLEAASLDKTVTQLNDLLNGWQILLNNGSLEVVAN
jgi:hypothetical protein